MLVVAMVEVKVVLRERRWCCYKVEVTDKLIVPLAGQKFGHHPLDLYLRSIRTIMSGYVTGFLINYV